MYDITDPLRLKPEMFVKISTKSADNDIRTPFLKINN